MAAGAVGVMAGVGAVATDSLSRPGVGGESGMGADEPDRSARSVLRSTDPVQSCWDTRRARAREATRLARSRTTSAMAVKAWSTVAVCARAAPLGATAGAGATNARQG